MVYLNKVTDGCVAEIAAKLEIMSLLLREGRIDLDIVDEEKGYHPADDAHRAHSGNTGIGLCSSPRLRATT